MSRKFNLFLGRSGQAFAKSEFLIRGWNTTVPDVDIGDDLFVVEDYDGAFYRMQVKTARGKLVDNGYSARFNISISQLRKSHGMELFYVFVVRFENKWQPPVLISRSDLDDLYSEFNLGSEKDNQLLLYFNFDTKKGTVTCSGQSLNTFLNNWDDFPMVQH